MLSVFTEDTEENEITEALAPKRWGRRAYFPRGLVVRGAGCPPWWLSKGLMIQRPIIQGLIIQRLIIQGPIIQRLNIQN